MIEELKKKDEAEVAFSDFLRQRQDALCSLNIEVGKQPNKNKGALLYEDLMSEVLTKVFGYKHFYPLQKEVILSILSGRDTLSVMATGAGKSLCYQLSSLLLPDMTVVIQPLLALMHDQVRQMRSLGIAAVCLNSSMSEQSYQQCRELVLKKKVRMLYLSPESVLKKSIIVLLKQAEVSLLVVDEAHCICEWGHDFRSDYALLANLRKNFPNVPCAAFTATATKEVATEIQKNLNFTSQNTFLSDFDRPNLYLSVVKKESNAFEQLERLLPKIHKRVNSTCGIIYCSTRKKVDKLAEKLQASGFKATSYHAGLNDIERANAYDDFINERVNIMVATIAFGMGINKSNIRFVIHYDLCKSIETYYQQIGRAGRDGKPAYCIVLYSQAEKISVHYVIEKEQKKIIESELTENNHFMSERKTKMFNDFIAYCKTSSCRRKALLSHFNHGTANNKDNNNPFVGDKLIQTKCKYCDICVPW